MHIANGNGRRLKTCGYDGNAQRQRRAG